MVILPRTTHNVLFLTQLMTLLNIGKKISQSMSLSCSTNSDELQFCNSGQAVVISNQGIISALPARL